MQISDQPFSTTTTIPATSGSTRPSGYDGIIPDGHHWVSANGVKCYKVPQQQMQDVLFTLPNINVGKLTEEQLERGLAYVEARYAEKNGEYFVYPVKFEKQVDINNRYWASLSTFAKALRAEKAQRRANALFG